MMNGNPLSLQEWKSCYEADAAENIFRLLMPFNERPLELRPVSDKEKLKGKFDKALRGIGMPVDDVRIISIGEVMRPLDWLSENDRNRIRTELCCAVASTADLALGAVMLEMSKAYDVTKGVRNAKGAEDVRTIYLENVKCMSVGGRFAKLVAGNLFKCLHFQIGFLATNDPASAAKISPFTESYADGHFGLGKTRDNTFVAITG